MIKLFRTLFDIPIHEFLGKEIKCFLLLILYTVTNLIFPTFVSLIIDRGIANSDLKRTIILSLLMLFIGILSVVFQYFQQISFYRLGQELVVNIKQKAYKTLIRSNIKFWTQNSIGDTLIILEDDIAILENLLTSTLSNCIVNIFVIIGISLFIFSIEWKCGILVFMLAFGFAKFQRAFGPAMEKSMDKLRKDIGGLASYTSETLQNANDLQAAGYEKIICEKYSKLNEDVVSSTIQQTKVVAGAQSAGNLFNILGLLIVISFGAYQVINGSITVGVLFALTVYVQRLYGPIVSISNAYIEIKNSLPKVKKIINLLETPYVIESGEYVPAKKGFESLKLEDISFSYDGKKVLKSFNFDIKKGEILGIVGENGIGKSTILKLILNLLVPDHGKILLNDISIRDYDNDFIRKQIGYIGQNGVLISGTLREILDPSNLCSDFEIQQMMHEFGLSIDRFEQKLDTYIDENHRNLSGGEFQKIALIRAFLEKKELYLLDEPTSAIDEKSEEQLCIKIQEKLNGKTAIIITHRPRILNICDRVVRMTNRNV